jgi:hypothetical protein
MKLDVRMLSCGLAGCVVVTLTASGCGGYSSGSSAPKEPSASDLQSSMRSSVASANSVHFNGNLSDNGVPVGVDMGVSRSGDLDGSITQNGAKLQVIGVDGKVYIKATPEFLKEVKAPADACSLICGHWVQLPPSEARPLTSQLTLQNLSDSVNSGQAAQLKESGKTTVNGTAAYVLKAPNGATVDVSQSSPHYPLQAHAGSGKTGTVTFSQWNSVPHPTPPPAKDVINLSGLH